MTINYPIGIDLLGQAGCKLRLANATVYVDPYLSNSVQELESADLKRLIPIPFGPDTVTDADWVLITHDHIDHCDPDTLPNIAVASPQARFMGPAPVVRLLREWGIGPSRLVIATESWSQLCDGVNVHAIPAAHPVTRRSSDGHLEAVGFLLEYKSRKLYIAGDTSISEDVIGSLMTFTPIDLGVLPVNERNFFRDRKGILGNMSVREAFQFADEIGLSKVIPVHWDMFEVNSVGLNEIKAVYAHISPRAELVLNPKEI